MSSDQSGPIRLQKLLSGAGVASRRAAEQMILERRVTVNGDVVATLGSKADPATDDVRVDGRRVKLATRLRYILLNKPRGYVTTLDDPQGRKTVLDLLKGVKDYVYPVGRLDYDTQGLLLLTSDGDLAARLMHPRHAVDRVYEAIVAGEPSDEAIAALRAGVIIDGRRTAPANVRRGASMGTRAQPQTLLVITLREGRNRQVRRMCSIVGHPVRELARVRLGPIGISGLDAGRWRDLTAQEVEKLQAASQAVQGTSPRPPRLRQRRSKSGPAKTGAPKGAPPARRDGPGRKPARRSRDS
jgi:23S rRNA pseudouridine2605 synthase